MGGTCEILEYTLMLTSLVLIEKTAVAGRVKSEVNCLPVENDEYRQVMDQRTKQEMKPSRETQVLSGPASSHGGNVLYPGSLGTSGNFNDFIVSSIFIGQSTG